MDRYLAHVLTSRDSLDGFTLKKFLLRFEFLPVNLIGLVVEILPDNYIPAGNVLNGHYDTIEMCTTEGFRLYKLLVSLDDLDSAADDCLSYLVLSQVDDDPILSDPEGSGPLGIEKVALRRLCLLNEIGPIRQVVVTGSRDTVCIRCDHKRCIALADLLAFYHYSLGRLIVDGEFCTLESRIALGISLIKVIINLCELDSAADDSVIAFDLLVVGLDVKIVRTVFCDRDLKNLIIDKIAFRCFDLLDQICAQRKTDLTVLVLIQSIIGETICKGRILAVDLSMLVCDEVPCPESSVSCFCSSQHDFL